MVRVAVAHPGPQHAGQTALGLQQAGLLGWFATSLYLGRRRVAGLESRLVRSAPATDLADRARLRLRAPAQRAHARYRDNLRFAERVVRWFERDPVDVLWAPPVCAAAVRALKPRGVTCVLEQTSVHRGVLDRIARAEFARSPDLFATRPAGSGPQTLAANREAFDLADLIVVGSAFAARTFTDNGVDPAKLRVIPYGYDERLFPAAPPVRPPLAGRPAEFLYVGRISALKGVAHLLDAFARIDPARARLTLAGEMEMPAAAFARLAGAARWLGRVPHAAVPALMRAADCFVFPSLFEGGGIVLYEAAAAGLGIIQSDACGDGVRAGNGVVIPAGSADAIAGAVEAALTDGALERWADASWRIREERTWARYRAAVAETVRELVGL